MERESDSLDPMPTKRRPDLKRVLESLNTVCTGCGYSIPPNEVRRADTENVVCPKCSRIFKPEKKG